MSVFHGTSCVGASKWKQWGGKRVCLSVVSTMATWGRYHGGRRPSSDHSFHSLTVIPLSALDKPSIIVGERRVRGVTARSPTLVTLHDTGFVECRWNDGWTEKTAVTWQSSASMIPAPGWRKQVFTNSRRSKCIWVTFYVSTSSVCLLLSVAQAIETWPTTKSVFLWYGFQRDVHLFWKLGITFTWTKFLEKSLPHNLDFPFTVSNEMSALGVPFLR